MRLVAARELWFQEEVLCRRLVVNKVHGEVNPAGREHVSFHVVFSSVLFCDGDAGDCHPFCDFKIFHQFFKSKQSEVFSHPCIEQNGVF